MFNEHRNGKLNPRKDSGSLAMFAAIRRASSLPSSLALAVLYDSFSVHDVSDYP
jgi:hypothetical protein